MTDDEYRRIAHILKNYAMYHVALDIAVELALMFHKQDETFDKSGWLRACDIEREPLH